MAHSMREGIKKTASSWKIASIIFCFVFFPFSLLAQISPIEQKFWRKIPTSIVNESENVRFVAQGFRDRVWITYNDSDDVAGTEGYGFQTLTVPSGWRRRIHESRTGQLWTSNPREILLYRNGSWLSFNHSTSTASSTNDAPYPIIGVLPSEFNHVLVLKSNQLEERDVLSNNSRILINSATSQIGAFIDIRLARDQGAWILGEKGVIKVAAPLRNLRRKFISKIYPLPDAFDHILTSSTLEIDLDQLLVHGSMTSFEEGKPPVKSSQLLMLHENQWSVINDNFQNWHDFLSMNTREELLNAQSSKTAPALNLKDFPDAQINDIAILQDGNWLVATDQGLFKECDSLWNLYSRNTVLSILSFNESDQSFMALTQSGVSRISLKSDNITHLLEWPKITIGDITPNKDIKLRKLPNNNFLILHGHTASHLNLDSFEWQIINMPPASQNSKTTFQSLNKSGEFTWLWIDNDTASATYSLRGLNEQNSPAILAELPGFVIDQTPISEMARSDTQKIWLSIREGLAHFNNQEWEFFSYADNNFSSQVHDILLPNRGNPLFATDSGIIEFTGTSFNQSLLSDAPIIQALQTENGNLWAISHNTIFRFLESTWIPLSITPYPDIQLFSIFEDQRNQLWLSTDQGIFSFSPAADYAPPDSFIPFKPNELVPDRSGTVAVSLHGIDKWRHSLDEDLFFSYKLDSDDWSGFQKNNSILLRNLSEGEHSLLVRAMDINGNIDQSPEQWDFSISIPWHYDSRFVISTIITALSTFFLIWMAIDRHLNLQRSYRNVEKMVRERTLQLEKANEQLLMHKKMRAMGALASGIAHDFNSILSIVQGSAQIIKSNLHNPPKIEKRLDRIETVVRQGTTLVRAMLGFAKDKKLQLSTIHVEDVVSATLEILNDKLPSDIHIQFQAEPNLPDAQGNAEYLQQILVNLLLNAFDALDNNGTIKIHISTTPPKPDIINIRALKPAESQAYIYLIITDYGSGIHSDNIDRIFEPFFTTKALSTKKGTGLGLAMVYELAQQMHFGISVGSQPNNFTLFSIQIPTP